MTTGTEAITGAPRPLAVRLGVANLIGIAAALFSLLYWVSDLIEANQGGFSTGQLWLTLVAEAAVPPIVIGLWWVRRDRLGRLGAVSAWAYAYAFVFFTFTVVYALVDGTPDYAALSDELGSLMTLHGLVMLLAGVGFGVATIRARTSVASGYLLAAGVVLVAASQAAPEGVQLVAAGVRDLGIGLMGVALLRSRQGAGSGESGIFRW
jgi:hypothetical protein